MKTRSQEIECYNDCIALTFVWHFGSAAAAEVAVKFQSDCKSVNTNIAASISYGKTSVRLMNRSLVQQLFTSVELIRHGTKQTCIRNMRHMLELVKKGSMNTLMPKQNGRHAQDDNFKCISFNENIWILIKISLKFVPKCPINIFRHECRQWLGADQSTSHF